MNWLVTGGAGYIGSHVVRMLSELGHKVTVLDNLSTGFADSLICGEELVRGDVGDVVLLNKIFSERKYDGVLHFAGSILVEESVSNPAKYFENNTVNTLRLMQTCCENGVKNFVFSSTAAVYGLPSTGVASEESPLTPCNPYGLSKLMSEYMLQDVARAEGLKFAILRYFNVAGADSQGRMGQRTPKATHLIKVCCEVALGKRPQLEIFGDDYSTSDGTCMRDYIHVEDLAQAHLLALDYLVKKNDSLIVNVGYGHGHSVSEVVNLAKKVTGKDFKVKMSPRRAGDPAHLVAENSKIKKLLGFSPKYDNLETIIRHAWQWELKCTSK